MAVLYTESTTTDHTHTSSRLSATIHYPLHTVVSLRSYSSRIQARLCASMLITLPDLALTVVDNL